MRPILNHIINELKEALKQKTPNKSGLLASPQPSPKREGGIRLV
jgi:hypothetical protein